MAGPIALFAMPPLFPSLTAFLGVSLSGIGFAAMTSFGIGISVMAIPFAILSPRLGWKTAGIACLGTITLGALITLGFPMFWGIFIGRFIAGLGFGMAFTWPVGALSVWFRKDEMGLATGIWSITLPVSGLLIFVLAPVLIASYGWISVLWFTLLFAIASLVVWTLLAKQPADDGSRPGGYFAEERSVCLSHDCIGSAFLDRGMWLVAVAWFALNYYLLGITSLAPAYFTTVLGFNLFTASALAILPVAMIIWSAPVTGMVSDRSGTRRTFILVSMAAGLFLCPVMFFLGSGLLPWALFFVVLGIVWGMAPATVFASPREIVGPEHAGPASGILNLMVGLAALSAPLVTESLVPVIGWQGALASTALPSVAGIIAMVRIKKLR
jgi:MFS family permease